MVTDRVFKSIGPHAENVQRIQLSPEHPLDIEIGAGVGMHAIQRAKQFPERRLYAIERTKNRYSKLAQRILNHPELNSISPIHASVENWLPRALPDSCISQCFILYPNPYPKNKHTNQRFINMPFFQVLLDKLRLGGEITFASNRQEYIDEVFLRAPEWNLKVLLRESIDRHTAPRSHFEKKYLQRGEICEQIVLKILDKNN